MLNLRRIYINEEEEQEKLKLQGGGAMTPPSSYKTNAPAPYTYMPYGNQGMYRNSQYYTGLGSFSINYPQETPYTTGSRSSRSGRRRSTGSKSDKGLDFSKIEGHSSTVQNVYNQAMQAQNTIVEGIQNYGTSALEMDEVKQAQKFAMKVPIMGVVTSNDKKQSDAMMKSLNTVDGSFRKVESARTANGQMLVLDKNGITGFVTQEEYFSNPELYKPVKVSEIYGVLDTNPYISDLTNSSQVQLRNEIRSAGMSTMSANDIDKKIRSVLYKSGESGQKIYRDYENLSDEEIEILSTAPIKTDDVSSNNLAQLQHAMYQFMSTLSTAEMSTLMDRAYHNVLTTEQTKDLTGQELTTAAKKEANKIILSVFSGKERNYTGEKHVTYGTDKDDDSGSDKDDNGIAGSTPPDPVVVDMLFGSTKGSMTQVDMKKILPKLDNSMTVVASKDEGVLKMHYKGGRNITRAEGVSDAMPFAKATNLIQDYDISNAKFADGERVPIEEMHDRVRVRTGAGKDAPVVMTYMHGDNPLGPKESRLVDEYEEARLAKSNLHKQMLASGKTEYRDLNDGQKRTYSQVNSRYNKIKKQLQAYKYPMPNNPSVKVSLYNLASNNQLEMRTGQYLPAYGIIYDTMTSRTPFDKIMMSYLEKNEGIELTGKEREDFIKRTEKLNEGVDLSYGFDANPILDNVKIIKMHVFMPFLEPRAVMANHNNLYERKQSFSTDTMIENKKRNIKSSNITVSDLRQPTVINTNGN